jgi:hypothetical protein
MMCDLYGLFTFYVMVIPSLWIHAIQAEGRR